MHLLFNDIFYHTDIDFLDGYMCRNRERSAAWFSKCVVAASSTRVVIRVSIADKNFLELFETHVIGDGVQAFDQFISLRHRITSLIL